MNHLNKEKHPMDFKEFISFAKEIYQTLNDIDPGFNTDNMDEFENLVAQWVVTDNKIRPVIEVALKDFIGSIIKDKANTSNFRRLST